MERVTPGEVKLIEAILEQVNVPRRGRGRPRKIMKRLIADKVYDGDPLRKRLKALKINQICPNLQKRTMAKLQDGRKLLQFWQRWKIKHTFSWLGTFRRLSGAVIA